MRQKSGREGSVEKTVKDIRRAMRNRHAREEGAALFWSDCAGEYWKQMALA